jgi:hypothetical protein
LRAPELLPGEVTVLYSGRMSKEKGVELLADAFLAAHATDPRLHLLAGGGPEESAVRDRLGDRASFLIEHGETGLLAPADPHALAAELLRVTGEPLLRERLRRTARAAVSGRSWEAALGQLAASYRGVLQARARRRSQRGLRQLTSGPRDHSRAVQVSALSRAALARNPANRDGAAVLAIRLAPWRATTQVGRAPTIDTRALRRRGVVEV